MSPLYFSAQCPTPPTELVVAKKGVYCSASSSFHTMPCQYAWDGDPNTVWHPTGSGEGAYTTLHLNEAILVTGVVVDQYSWSSGFAANIGLMFNSSDWIQLRVTDSSQKTIWEDSKAHETKVVTVFIKEVGPFRGSAFGGMKDIRLKGCLLSQAFEVAQGQGTTKRNNPTKRPRDFPPQSGEVSIKTICAIRTLTNLFQICSSTNMFGFASDDCGEVKKLPGLSLLPGLVLAAAIILALFCITALVYGFHARRRHRWHISEEERVSFSPSRQGGSEEEVGAKNKTKMRCL